jgi:hypothetical protein
LPSVSRPRLTIRAIMIAIGCVAAALAWAVRGSVPRGGRWLVIGPPLMVLVPRRLLRGGVRGAHGREFVRVPPRR